MKYFIIVGAAVLAIFAVVLIIIFSTKAAAPAQSGSYTHISQETAKEMMQKNDGHIVVDVRRQDEFESGHIPGAVCIPNESISTQKPKELPDFDQIILVYCRSGRRSKEASQKLYEMGYRNVYEFGGILDWTGEITKQKTPEPTPVLVVDTGKKKFYATLEDNSSAKALIEKLSAEPLTLDMSDYGGFEKVASLPYSLPRNDTKITTSPGDIILYNGNSITVYYGENTWSFTRLARIGNVSKSDLLEALGPGSATVSFYLEWSE